MQLFNRLVGFICCAAVLAGSYFFARWQLDEMIYKRRLEGVLKRYESLQKKYDKVVRKTAVTELLVEQGSVSVVVRTVEGRLRTIHTPFRADSEIYIDYVVIDGRIWIRRVFDSQTPPDEALVIDPELATIDWRGQGAACGKAVYRQLTAGRWVVTVTGNGSLGLARVEGGRTAEVVRGTEVRDYD